MSANDDGSITVTLVHAATGQSESIPVQANGTTVQELAEWAGALFGLDGAGLVLTKDGQRLSVASSTTLGQAGVQNGDLIAVASARQELEEERRPPQQRLQLPQRLAAVAVVVAWIFRACWGVLPLLLPHRRRKRHPPQVLHPPNPPTTPV